MNRISILLGALCSAAALALGAGCGEGEGGEGPTMKPGEDCTSCHHFTVAGTVFSKPNDPTSGGVSGVTVTVTDSNGVAVKLTTNSAGNFYSSAALTPPLSAQLDYAGRHVQMGRTVPTGACSSCHTDPPQNAAPGRTYAP